LIAGNEKEIHRKWFISTETEMGPKGLIGWWEAIQNRIRRKIYNIGFGKGVSHSISFGIFPAGSDLKRKRKRKCIHG
jgi:hypothetical protein